MRKTFDVGETIREGGQNLERSFGVVPGAEALGNIGTPGVRCARVAYRLGREHGSSLSLFSYGMAARSAASTSRPTRAAIATSASTSVRCVQKLTMHARRT